MQARKLDRAHLAYFSLTRSIFRNGYFPDLAIQLGGKIAHIARDEGASAGGKPIPVTVSTIKLSSDTRYLRRE